MGGAVSSQRRVPASMLSRVIGKAEERVGWDVFSILKLLQDVPESLVFSILIDWLQVKDVVSLDVACCKQLDRVWWLSVFRGSSQHIFTHQLVEQLDSISCAGFLKWAMKRRVVVNYVVFPPNYPFEAQKRLLIRLSSAVKSVDARHTVALTKLVVCIHENCPDLKWINLSGVLLSQLAAEGLIKCSKLQHLDLSNATLTAKSLSFLADLKALRHLDLSHLQVEWFPNVTADILTANIIYANPHLEYIAIRGGLPRTLRALAVNCPKLTQFHIIGGGAVDAVEFEPVLKNHQNITHITLHAGTLYLERRLSTAVAAHCSQLASLTCHPLSTENMESIAVSCRKLTHIEFTSKISDHSLLLFIDDELVDGALRVIGQHCS